MECPLFFKGNESFNHICQCVEAMPGPSNEEWHCTYQLACVYICGCLVYCVSLTASTVFPTVPILFGTWNSLVSYIFNGMGQITRQYHPSFSHILPSRPESRACQEDDRACTLTAFVVIFAACMNHAVDNQVAVLSDTEVFMFVSKIVWNIDTRTRAASNPISIRVKANHSILLPLIY